MTIRIFVTGGTFDKEYDEISGRLFFKETHVPEMLRLGRSRVPVALTPLMLIDSLDMSDVERERIVATCRAGAAAGRIRRDERHRVHVECSEKEHANRRVRKYLTASHERTPALQPFANGSHLSLRN